MESKKKSDLSSRTVASESKLNRFVDYSLVHFFVLLAYCDAYDEMRDQHIKLSVHWASASLTVKYQHWSKPIWSKLKRGNHARINKRIQKFRRSFEELKSSQKIVFDQKQMRKHDFFSYHCLYKCWRVKLGFWLAAITCCIFGIRKISWRTFLYSGSWQKFARVQQDFIYELLENCFIITIFRRSQNLFRISSQVLCLFERLV